MLSFKERAVFSLGQRTSAETICPTEHLPLLAFFFLMEKGSLFNFNSLYLLNQETVSPGTRCF